MKRLKTIFNEWAQKAHGEYVHKQWILSKWEVLDGIDWPESKVELLFRTIREALELKKTDSLIDVGCGGGWIHNGLKSLVKRAVGLDISFEMLKNARLADGKNDLVCGDACRLPVRDGAFEAVICYFVIINFSDPQHIAKVVSELLRVLKKGGRALIGQIPDRNFSSHYDAAKKEYLDYCGKTFAVGKNIRDICLVPVYPMDRKFFIDLLEKQRVRYCIRDSFNPFYRPGQPETVDWRFDLVLEKDF